MMAGTCARPWVETGGWWLRWLYYVTNWDNMVWATQALLATGPAKHAESTAAMQEYLGKWRRGQVVRALSPRTACLGLPAGTEHVVPDARCTARPGLTPHAAGGACVPAQQLPSLQQQPKLARPGHLDSGLTCSLTNTSACTESPPAACTRLCRGSRGGAPAHICVLMQSKGQSST